MQTPNTSHAEYWGRQPSRTAQVIEVPEKEKAKARTRTSKRAKLWDDLHGRESRGRRKQGRGVERTTWRGGKVELGELIHGRGSQGRSRNVKPNTDSKSQNTKKKGKGKKEK